MCRRAWLHLFEVKVKHKNDLTALAKLADQVIECFNAAAAVIQASKLDPEEAKEFRQLWADVYSSAGEVHSKIGDTYPELDPFPHNVFMSMCKPRRTAGTISGA